MVVRALLSLTPVALFLAALWALDSYKLIRPALLARAVAAGFAVAIVSYGFAKLFLGAEIVSATSLSRYVAPAYEEIFKALVVVWAIRTKRVGFMVDAAILGFAVGTGFATVENIYYLVVVQESNLALWGVRGFGTAILHGSMAAIVGIVAQALGESRGQGSFRAVLPGLALAVVVHSAYNHVVLAPLASTALLLFTIPPLLMFVFQRSEKVLRGWLDVGFGSDVELLGMLRSGEIASTRIGQYLRSLRGRFPGEVLADMLCFLQLHVELSIKAKGLLLLQEAGLEPPADPQIGERLRELAILQKSIGTTGRLALAPLVNTGSREIWQLRLLESHAAARS
ncbi:MAG TPA: PrsW family glutamic-type intramembrane protease [Thermoanaerobaculia bacterium]|nr:PrsW family glutamic-type intramembrane protease [Thermoanaerobaculia bacterium]